ncbi:hypothetical protein B0H17DRAFT_1092200 [Mycena rosella]|uniref:Uncharacterized protein n=1 Tax=Mycena rosella TaxID=1033263 RepID=A0AAD7CV11_MYCRO|nr:hypothetical protein B0H17DRAFT_1092200 [Mycena rosella]
MAAEAGGKRNSLASAPCFLPSLSRSTLHITAPFAHANHLSFHQLRIRSITVYRSCARGASRLLLARCWAYADCKAVSSPHSAASTPLDLFRFRPRLHWGRHRLIHGLRARPGSTPPPHRSRIACAPTRTSSCRMCPTGGPPRIHLHGRSTSLQGQTFSLLHINANSPRAAPQKGTHSCGSEEPAPYLSCRFEELRCMTHPSNGNTWEA